MTSKTLEKQNTSHDLHRETFKKLHLIRSTSLLTGGRLLATLLETLENFLEKINGTDDLLPNENLKDVYSVSIKILKVCWVLKSGLVKSKTEKFMLENDKLQDYLIDIENSIGKLDNSSL